MDRRLIAVFIASAAVIGTAGYALARSQSTTTTIEATAPVTLLPPTSAPAEPEATTTTRAPRSTLPPTPRSEVFTFAAGGGCTPGTNLLPDGEYYGSVIVNDDRSLDFNLKCLFLADDLPDDFDQIFAERFPGETFAATGFDLVDPASVERRVRYLWNSDFRFGGFSYSGDEGYVGFTNNGEEPFDAVITVVDGAATTIVDLDDLDPDAG